MSLWFLVYYKKYYDEYKSINNDDENLLKERKYKNQINILPYSTSLLIEFSNWIYSKISIISKYNNVDLDRDSTGPLEHTFGRSRIKCNHMHTFNKFLTAVGEINEHSLSLISEEIEKVKGRSLNFGVTIEDQNDEEIFFTSTPQQIAYEFLSLIHIIPDDGLVQNEYENLFSFFEYLKDFIEEKKTRPLTVNRITLGTQQTQTIKQRMCFTIAKEKNEIIEFLNAQFPKQKIDKKFLLKFYQEIVAHTPLYPSIEEKIQRKIF